MGKPSSRLDPQSKAEQKFQKKVKFYERVGETVAVLNVQKTITKKKKLNSRQKKLKAYDLSTISEFLPGLEAPTQSPSAAKSNVSCKSRLKIILKERKQLDLVLNHDAFKADPLAAIQQHLESTQPIEPTKKTDKCGNKNGSKKRKEKKAKASAGPSLMEI